jgi:hypothetical protein
MFTYSSPVCQPLLQAFPFPSTLGEVTLHPLSQACVFIYSSRGKWAFPPLLWSFPSTVEFSFHRGVFLPPWLLQAFPVLVAGCVPWLLPSLVGIFIYSSVSDSPPPPSAFRVPCPLCYVSFLLLLLIIQFLFSFFPGWGLVWPGCYADLAQGCLWEHHVSLSSPCGLRLPTRSGHWCLAAREPSWFLRLTWSGTVTPGLGLWRSQVLPLLGGFACKVYLQCLSKILL